MNKMISFRDLIDLEPKPKKVKYDSYIYELEDARYINCYENSLDEKLTIYSMSKPNIEIIEEDKPIIEEIDEANENEYYYSQDNRYNELVDEVMYHQVKINEIIRYINKKESE